MSDCQRKLLLFGGSGQIGQSIAQKFKAKDWEVFVVSRSVRNNSAHEIQWDVDVEKKNAVPSALLNSGSFDSVCWAQGVNLNDSIYTFEPDSHKKVYEANVSFILSTLAALVSENLLCKPARLCLSLIHI